MLTFTVLGLVALAAWWTANLLILGAAWQDRQKLVTRLRWLTGQLPGPRPMVLPARVDAELLAEHVIEQRGRARVRAPQPEILLHARTQTSVLHGGALELSDGRRVHVPSAPAGVVEVWTDARAPEASEPELGFEAAHAEARRARGWLRTLRRQVRRGQAVFLVAELTPDGDHLVARPLPDPTAHGEPRLILSTQDPRAFYRDRIRFASMSMVGILFSALLPTALALTPPVFQGWSTAGGALALAHFLLVQPVGVWLHDRLQAPPRSNLELTWKA